MDKDQTHITFLKSQLWKSTIKAAFSRAGKIYPPGTGEKEKNRFRMELFEFISVLIKNDYEYKTPSDQQHLNNISNVMDFATGFGFVTLGFGHAQKVLNLYLKYLWCMGEITLPPHFPVDRIIQKKMKVKTISNWTKWESSVEYLKVIKHAKAQSQQKGFQSIAEYELWFYNQV